jgi:hypothetical protein
VTGANDTPELRAAPGPLPPAAGTPGEPGEPVRDDPDLELLTLPAPPRGQRLLAMTLMAAVVGLAVGLLSQLRGDLAYFFSSGQAVDIGEVTSLDLSTLEPNSFVRVRGTPMLSRMVRFERPLLGDYAVFPLAGQRQIFVQLPAAALDDTVLAARGQYSGRLQTFGDLGSRMRSVRGYLAQRMGMPVTAESFVILAEEPPESHGWALALGALCLAIIGVNVWLMLRWFRPLPRLE